MKKPAVWESATLFYPLLRTSTIHIMMCLKTQRNPNIKYPGGTRIWFGRETKTNFEGHFGLKRYTFSFKTSFLKFWSRRDCILKTKIVLKMDAI